MLFAIDDMELSPKSVKEEENKALNPFSDKGTNSKNTKCVLQMRNATKPLIKSRNFVAWNTTAPRFPKLEGDKSEPV